ncbi:translocation/assembly module TamB domain-containing protein [Geothrix sp. 21YS21S-2]|uniref:translocation/assembly module TamB domain-containing protein n=1 Tax=Geothrix sp. 21YS21S-2 TaxID=3068893 RepID=UPI0027BA34A1|nr:translocation/assembly module TamB domain-containing protein [Geothrix sp. 21YS21S-2]
MSRRGRVLRGLAAGALALLLLCAGVAGWLGGTGSGVRWLLATLARRSGAVYSARKVEGRLGRLHLEGVRLAMGTLDVEIDRADLDWNPGALPFRRIPVQALVLQGVRVRDHAPREPEPKPFLWPAVPDVVARLRVEVARAEVADLTYRRLDDPAVKVTRLRTSARWEASRLSLPALELETPQGRLGGTLAVAFREPAFQADLALVPGAPLGGVDKATLRVRLGAGAASELLAGPVQGVLEGRGRCLAAVDGTLRLAPTRLAFQIVQGRWLNGSLTGSLGLDLRAGWQGDLAGRGLDPAGLDPAWKGLLNFDLKGAGQAERTEVQAVLLRSRLHGQALDGRLSLLREGGEVTLSSLFLRGRGFEVTASGRLSQRIQLEARVQEFALLLPGTRGSLQAKGWGRRAQGASTGELAGQGRGLAGFGGKLDRVTFKGLLQDRLALDLALEGLALGRFQAGSLGLKAQGTVARHELQATLRSREAQVGLALSGGYAQGAWTGTLLSLAGRDRSGPWTLQAPAALEFGPGHVRIAAFRLQGRGPERLDASARILLNPVRGSASAAWDSLDLGRLRSWIAGLEVQGATTGRASGELRDDGRLTLSSQVQVRGSLASGGRTWVLEGARLEAAGDERGLQGALGLRLAGGGGLDARFSAPGPARLALPPGGSLDLAWNDLDPAWARPWLPSGIAVEGRLAGKVQARVQADRSFMVTGRADLTQGRVHGRTSGGEVEAVLGSTTLAWTWSGEALKGDLDLALAGHGGVKGGFRLPLAARWPLVLDRDAALEASLAGRIQEKGLLGAHLPSLAQETSGELELDLRLRGSPRAPALAGRVVLSGAGAYLPAAGITLRDVRCTALLEKDLIRLQDFHAASGPGSLQGSADFHLAGPSLVSWKGALEGKDFQVVAFPEVDALASPALTFEGGPGRLQVRGEVLLPTLKITGEPDHGLQAPSADVRVLGREAAAARAFPLALDARVKLRFGDHVLVSTGPIDARLGGELMLVFSNPDQVQSQGQIQVVQGRFRTYGVDLDITRGRLYYAGGPLADPTLDVLAVRQVGEVKAGVTVTGPLTAPVTALYSDPAMPDEDKLSYIVMGHALGAAGGAGVDLMGRASSYLISKGQSAVLQDRIKSRLGLSTLDIRTAPGDDPRLMGYKPLVSTSAAAANAQAVPAAQAMMTLGKYLTPRLFVSYGRSLFTGGNLFLLRFDLQKHVQAEAQTGTESGVDIYYKLEFK